MSLPLPFRRANRSQQRPLWWRLVRYLLLALTIGALIDGLYLATLWPDWEELSSGPVPKSNFIRAYETQREIDRKLPPLYWQPVPRQRIAPIMGKAAIVAEDSRFYEHEGIDTEAIQEAMEKNIEKGKVVYGASTISQQTVKNMFLSGSRDYLRKWHELLLTWSMERNLSKPRILEIYLNIAEFGTGVYGVEAASRYYWNIPASELSYQQAVQLAASLPSPRKHNPRTNTRSFQRRAARIARHLKTPEPPTSEAAIEQLPQSDGDTPDAAALVAPAPASDAAEAPIGDATPLVVPVPAETTPAPAATDPGHDTPSPTPE